MITGQGFLKSRAFKIAVPVIGVVFGLNALIYNPSEYSAREKLAWMRLEMERLVCCNDPVMSNHSTAKYGGAWLTKSVKATGNAEAKYENNVAKLPGEGWAQISGKSEWCNHEVMLKISRERSDDKRYYYYYYAMIYDGSTIKKCRS